MNYPIKTLSHIPLVLKGFRKTRGLTQAAMAERLGITQQSYAYFEANPATATVERFVMVLRMLDVEISLDQTSSAASKRLPDVKTTHAATTKTEKPSASTTPGRIIATAQKKENW